MIETPPNKEARRTRGTPWDVVRGINRHLIFNLIRKRRLISRADLCLLSGLQPSVVSRVVDQLIAEHWVLEGPTSLARGRRPMLLSLDNGRVIVAVDIRQTQSTVGLADANGRILFREVLATSADSKVTSKAIVQSIQRLIRSSHRTTVEGVGIGVPGRYDSQTDRLFAPISTGKASISAA